jgi:hypothetical protein
VGAGELRMSAPIDEKLDRQTEHLENLARMLREIEEQLSERDAEEPSETPPPNSN